MKHFLSEIGILSVLILMLVGLGCSRAETDFKAYKSAPDAVLVTNEPCEYPLLTELVMGKGEICFIDVRGAETIVFYSSNAYVARARDTGAIIAGDKGKTRIKVYANDNEDDFVEIKITVKSAPTCIEAKRNELEIELEKTAFCGMTVPENCAGLVEYSSSDDSIVSVDENGMLCAVAPGECEITARAYNGVGKTIKVRAVYPPAAEVKTPAELKGYEGEDALLTYELDGGYYETVSFSSVDEEIASVDENGRVSFIKPGSTQVYVHGSGGNSAACTVTVLEGARALEFENKHYYMYEGGTLELNVTSTGGSGVYLLSSSDESIAVCDGHFVTAVREGTALVYALSPNGIRTACGLTVSRRPDELELIVPETQLAAGESMECSSTRVVTALLPCVFATSDESVCTVSDFGLITALNQGECTLFLSCGGIEFEEKIIVKQLSNSIGFENETMMLGVGDSCAAKVIYKDDGCGCLMYASKQPEICGITADGTLKAISTGSTVIVAYLSNGTTAYADVTVTEAPESIAFALESVRMSIDDSLKLEISYPEGRYALTEFESADTSVCRVEDGILYACEKPGRTEITARTLSGASAVLPVTVLEAPDAIELNCASAGEGSFDYYLPLKAGEEYALKVNASEYTFLTCVFESADPGVASVDENGRVTALNTGLAKLAVRTASGKEALILAEITAP